MSFESGLILRYFSQPDNIDCHPIAVPHLFRSFSDVSSTWKAQEKEFENWMRVAVYEGTRYKKKRGLWKVSVKGICGKCGLM